MPSLADRAIMNLPHGFLFYFFSHPTQIPRFNLAVALIIIIKTTDSVDVRATQRHSLAVLQKDTWPIAIEDLPSLFLDGCSDHPQ